MTPRIVRRRQWDIANRKRRDAGRLVTYTLRDAEPMTAGDCTYLPRKLHIEMHRDRADRLRIEPHGGVSLAGPERKADGTWTRSPVQGVRVYLSADTTPKWVAALVAEEEGRP